MIQLKVMNQMSSCQLHAPEFLAYNHPQSHHCETQGVHFHKKGYEEELWHLIQAFK